MLFGLITLLDFAVKKFIIIFLIGIFVFSLANVVSMFVRSDSYDDPDTTERYGFPLLISAEVVMCVGKDEHGTYVYYHGPNPYFSRTALWFDIAIAVVASSLVASIYNAHPFRAKRTEHEI